MLQSLSTKTKIVKIQIKSLLEYERKIFLIFKYFAYYFCIKNNEFFQNINLSKENS